MVRFLICNWSYHTRSGGVRVLYKLAEIIQDLGYPAFMINFDEGETEESDYMKSQNLSYFKGQITDEDIVFYPDVVTDNFLKAKNVIRYLLHRPLHAAGTAINYGDDDLIITHAKYLDFHLDDLFILLDDRHLFYPPDDWEDKENMACVYFDKGRVQLPMTAELSALLSQFDKIIHLSRTFPEKREDFADILRRSKLLICLDALTGVMYESLLCGTPVYFIEDFFKLSKFEGFKNYGSFDSISKYENAIEEVPLFQLEYEIGLQNNAARAQNFISIALEYFQTLDKFKQEYPQIYRQFIQHKKCRWELDNYRYLKYITANNSMYI